MDKKRILPDGNIFGDKNSDEFSIEFDGETINVFKRFEYLSIPFSITGNQEVFKELLNRAEQNGTSFKEELDKDENAKGIVNEVFDHMSSNPAFSKQVMDTLLPEIYVDDNIITAIDTEEFEDHLAKIVVGWKHLADFYCIEGLVGGDGEQNPFVSEEKSSFVAGALDSLETTLPALRKNVDQETWNDICLKLSSVVGRDHKHVDHAVTVLGIVFGEKDISPEDVQHSIELVDDLTKSRLETNTEIGKFYNTLIRFHNWMPLALKEGGLEGDAYDSVCAPTKKAIELLEDQKIKDSLAGITDATSPKGLALATLVDDEKIGDKQKLLESTQALEETLNSNLDEARKEFATFELQDNTFYTGLVGGKWKGLKLLHDTKETKDGNFQVPDGFAISSLEINRALRDNGITDIINQNIFSLSEGRRKEILDKISGINLDVLADSLGNELIVRSSMYGEDGASNFSGTYESIPCTKENLQDAVRGVINSYFSREAIKSREDIGLAHIPGISLIVQERIPGKGGVVYLTDDDFSASFAETPEDAVLGNGTHKTSRNIDELVAGTPLEKVKQDLQNIYSLFGNSDIEFVTQGDNIYFTQLRPKHKATQKFNTINGSIERLDIENIEDLENTKLDSTYVVRMNFLGRENIMNKEGEIMDFIRANKDNIAAVEGNMPSVAHIPNKIEGHFKIPYSTIGGDNGN